MASTFLISNGDVVYSASGTTTMVTGKTKTRQDLGEMLAVETQPDGFGAGIIGIIDKQQDYDDGLDSNLELVIYERLQTAARRFIAMQQASVSNRVASEIVAKVVNLDVAQSLTDPRSYQWRIDFQTKDGQYQTLRGRVGV